MNKTYEQKINTFTGGMANDVRETDTTKYAYTKNFDTFSYKHRLVPYRSYEAGNDTLSRKIFNFLYVTDSAGVTSLFGLGNPTATGATMYQKTTFTDGTWTATANNVNDVGAAETAFIDCNMVYYANQARIYGASGTNDIFAYDPTGSGAWTTIGIGVLFGTTARLVVHSKDDILYLGFKNKIYYKNGAGSFTLGLTLPVNYTLKTMCEYGNYLAIGCVSNSSLVTTSKVFLWDRDTSLTTLSESIDWGEGSLNILEELDGRLIGISIQARSAATTLLTNTTVSFKYYAGVQGAVEFARVTGQTAESALSLLGGQKQKVNNRIYFPMVMTMPEGNATREGIWSVGRNLDGGYSVTCEYQSSDGTIPTAIDGFIIIGQMVFIAYSNSGSLSGNISKQTDTAVFSNNSTYESLILNGGDSSLKKKLLGVTVYTTPIPSGGSVTLKHRTDSGIDTVTAFTTIFTDTTQNDVSHSAINIESTGATLPEFNELQFQIISTGGASITGLSFAYEVTGKRLYE